MLFLFVLLPLVFAENYLVQFKDGVSLFQIDSHLQKVHIRSVRDYGLSRKAILSKPTLFQVGSVVGYTGFFTRSEVDDLVHDPVVAVIEKDSRVYTYSTQSGADWGLARISHRDLGGKKEKSTFEYILGDGHDVKVYIVDTGVYTEHKDFQGRASFGTSIPKGSTQDHQGHGTFCASLIGGKTYGVAKNASLIAVKVLGDNGSGSLSDVVKGIEWVVKKHKTGTTPSVISMSLGGGKSVILNRVADAAVDSGVVVIVAAGNEAQDACDVSPAGAEKVITVGATTSQDTLAYFSNVGKCVDILSPGFNILGAFIGDTSAETTMSGTSMACPFTAGVVASILSRHPKLSPKQVKEHLLDLSTSDAIDNLDDDTPNQLVYNDPHEGVMPNAPLILFM